MYLSYATVHMLANAGDQAAKKVMRLLAKEPGLTPMFKDGCFRIERGPVTVLVA